MLVSSTKRRCHQWPGISQPVRWCHWLRNLPSLSHSPLVVFVLQLIEHQVSIHTHHLDSLAHIFFHSSLSHVLTGVIKCMTSQGGSTSKSEHLWTQIRLGYYDQTSRMTITVFMNPASHFTKSHIYHTNFDIHEYCITHY